MSWLIPVTLLKVVVPWNSTLISEPMSMVDDSGGFCAVLNVMLSTVISGVANVVKSSKARVSMMLS